MKRQEFPAKVKLAAWEAAKWHCTRCTGRLYPGKYRYNHRIPDALGGLPALDNCELLCLACDGEQTYQTDIPLIAKSKRIARKHAGIRKPRRIVRWRRFDGSIVQAQRER